MKRLVVEENGGWDPKERADNCHDLETALKEIARMIEEGFYAGFDSPLGWDWELKDDAED